MPDTVKEQCRQDNELIKEVKEKKSRSTQDAAAPYRIQRNQMYINGNVNISAPQPQDLFKGPKEQIKLNKILFIASEAVNEQERNIKGFVTKTESIENVQDAYTRITQICGDSDHIMCAYSVRVNGGDVSGYVDDGELGGGAKLKSVWEHKTSLMCQSLLHGCVGESIWVKKDLDV